MHFTLKLLCEAACLILLLAVLGVRDLTVIQILATGFILYIFKDLI